MLLDCKVELQIIKVKNLVIITFDFLNAFDVTFPIKVASISFLLFIFNVSNPFFLFRKDYTQITMIHLSLAFLFPSFLLIGSFSCIDYSAWRYFSIQGFEYLPAKVAFTFHNEWSHATNYKSAMTPLLNFPPRRLETYRFERKSLDK